jgi:hypothetical protein
MQIIMPYQKLILQLKDAGITPHSVYANLSVSELIEIAIMRKEGFFLQMVLYV